MSIKYNNKVIAGKYKEQIIPFANTIDAGIAKIATQEEINEGIDNTSIVTPVYLAQKQDKLIAGDGININEANIISSKITPDKVTIVENENNTISTVARKTVNESIIYDWEGTEAEYHQALMNGEINPDWYCYITDDELSVSYNDVLSRTLINIAPDGEEVIKDLSKESLHDNITNCITEIPQRIKLELNNGTLTLKAGSEVIVPNGFEANGTTPKFDYVTITNDLTYKPTWGNGYKNFASVQNNGTTLGMCREDYASSGASEPTIKGSGQIWYDTANNIVKRYNGTSWQTTNDALFSAEMTGGTDGIASIDEVFNGMGYIGSIIWLDKDVKLLVGDGRNEDGTLNNLEIKRASLKRVDVTNWGTRTDGCLIYTDAFTTSDYTFALNFQNIERFTNPNYSNYYKYDEQNNKWYFRNGADADYKEVRLTFLAKNIELENGVVKSLPAFESFRAVDYNDYKNDINTLNNITNTLDNITNTLDNTKVNKAGDTMTGNLKIQGGSTQHVVQCISNLLMSENPTVATGVGKFQVLDKNGNYLMQAGCERNTDGRNSAFIRAHSPTDWNKAATIQVTYLRDGKYGCSFPMCTTKATTASSARSDLIAVVTQNYVSGTSWYRVWSDGWIEQGGKITQTGVTVTFLKAFANTSYTALITNVDAGCGGSFEIIGAFNRTAKSMFIQRGGTGYGNITATFTWYACGY